MSLAKELVHRNLHFKKMRIMCLLLGVILVGCNSTNSPTETDEKISNPEVNANQEIDGNITDETTSNVNPNDTIDPDNWEEIIGNVSDIGDGQMRIIESAMVFGGAEAG